MNGDDICNMDPLKALIFDFDGLMVDTETAIYITWREIYEQHGYELPLETYVQCVGSHNTDYNPAKELDQMVGRVLDWDTLLAEQSRRNRELHQDLGPFPGIKELLLEANETGVKCAVASSSNSEWVHGWLHRLGLWDHFDAVITRDLVERPKPAPDLFLLAMSRLGVTGTEAVVLEDSVNGLRAAVAAEVPCIIVPNTVTRGLDFSAARAVLPTLGGVGLAGLRRHLELVNP
jgi:putative hydrolase of the HAD superfamily